LILGRVIKKIIPKSTRKAIIIVISASIITLFIKINDVTIKEPNIKLKTTRNIVDIITPAFHTHVLQRYVSYENNINIEPKTSIVVVDIVVAKNNSD